jgi:hypothetical protein
MTMHIGRRMEKHWSTLSATVFILALAFLGYVHQHIAILTTSYSITSKERELSKLSDAFQAKNYTVSKLHSLGYLEQKKQDLGMELVYPEKIRIVRVQAAEPGTSASDKQAFAVKPWSFLGGFVKVAQAKTSR